MTAAVSSEDFVRVDVNRDSLQPVAVPVPPEQLIHRQVEGDAAAEGFSKSRGHPVYPVRVPARNLSFSVGYLDPEAKTSNHRHAYESLIYVLEGEGYSIIEGARVEWREGDALYVPPWAWHQHVAAATGPARYLTGTNLPLLQSLGQTVLREEER